MAAEQPEPAARPGQSGPVSQRFLETRLKLGHLGFLVVVAEERSIAKAAARLNVSQPAATKMLREIEDRLGLTLFERSRRGAAPTAYGERVLVSARAVLGELRHLGEDLSALRTGLEGQVRVGTLLTAAAALLPKSIAHLRASHRGIAVSISEGTFDVLLPRLRTGDLDLVLGRVPDAQLWEGLTVVELYREPTWVLARSGHPLLARDPLDPEEALAADWILPSPQTMLRQDLDLAFRAAGRAPLRPAVESVSALANHRLIGETDLLALLPREAARFYVERGLLARLPVELGLPVTRTGMLQRADRPLAPAAERFAAAVRAVARELDVHP
ncbi:MAG: LysR family transcriptional regulator [Methylobacteriaceae bacterium]|nr:LysR family transcriptional regulator [Methylobacteriaceae bacterium]